MRFYAVSTEAVELTYRALQQLDRGRKGSHRPSRALRVATLFGHLQCRARGGRSIQVGCRQLAEAWHLHPREIRADLQDLEAIGWLSYTSSTTGLCIHLNEPDGSPLPVIQGGGADALDDTPAEQPTAGLRVQSVVAPAEPQAIAEEINSPEPSAEPERTPAMNQLISTFAAVYNQHKPQSWPAYKPTGAVLANRLRQAIRQAGGTEAFEALLIQALQGMPEFWRVTYPEGRSGAECASALLKVDRASEGRGVEHWHLFSWAALAQRHCSGNGGNTAAVGQGVAPGTQETDLEKANRLLFWSRNHWHGQGIEAAKLDRREKWRLAELLEAEGQGIAGTAAEQFSKPPRQN